MGGLSEQNHMSLRLTKGHENNSPSPPLNLRGGWGALLNSNKGYLRDKENGVTLIELIIVISIIGILVVALGFTFQGWLGRYKVESQMKEMHIDLMNARASAMQRNRAYFVTWGTLQYVVYEDTSPAPDGNGNLEAGFDRLVMQKSLDRQYPITWSDITDTEVEFTTNGLSNDTKTICSNTDADADYNCIEISATRINLGQLTTKIPAPYNGECKGTNCVAK